jgi:cytochrome bd ubiquinol oxidase subunit II
MLPFLLGVVMAAALTAYALLGGADYGGGVWDLLASGRTKQRQRATVARAINPVWEANHVWLILVVTVLFTGFPPAYAWLGTHLHIPLMLALAGIVFRGSAFAFRSHGPADQKTRWGRVFAGASAGTPVLLGVVIGAITQGQSEATAGTGFRAAFVDPWLTLFALSVGLFTLVLFTYLAAVYLTLEAREPAVVEAFRRRALASGLLTAAMALATLVVADPDVRAGLTLSAWAIPLHLLTGAFAIAAFVSLATRRFWWARTFAVLQVTLIVWGWALSQWPFLIRPHITFQSAAAPRATLILLLQALGVGGAVVIPSLVYLFRIFGPREHPG